MEFLKDFGFNPVLLIAQIINFLVILFILKKLMYKPVLDMLKKREEEIKKGLSNKEKADKLLLEAVEKETKTIQKAQEKAEKIVNDAKIEANEAKAQIEENARKEAQRLIEQARATITRETLEAEERLTRRIGGIAIALLEKSLQGIFGKNEQKTILKKAQSELQKQRI